MKPIKHPSAEPVVEVPVSVLKRLCRVYMNHLPGSAQSSSEIATVQQLETRAIRKARQHSKQQLTLAGLRNNLPDGR